MKWYEREKFWIELGIHLLCFYRNGENIYLRKYKDYKIIDEKIINNGCRELNSVILSKNGSITIIYSSLNGELILNTLLRDEIVNRITLMKSEKEYKHMEIASVNNSLNIFYINDMNNISTLCFRVLSNTLTLTPPIIIDAIDTRCDVPYIVSANDSELGVGYVKIGSPNIVGYRKLDFKRNSWSNFRIIDTCQYLVEDINFIIKRNIVAYSYCYKMNRKGYIIFGIGKEDEVKKNVSEELDPINSSVIMISEGNKMDVIYAAGNILKVKDVEINRDVKVVDEIAFKGIEHGEKCGYNSDKDISANKILIIKGDGNYMFTDSAFPERISVQKYQSDIGINRYISGDSIISDDELIKKIEEAEDNGSPDDVEIIKTLMDKLKGYEEAINKFTQKFILIDEEKKKLLDNIDYLNDQMNKKNHMINSFERALTERQNLVTTYEKKIKGLSDSFKSKNANINNSEIQRLKDIIKKNDEEKTRYINEINGYKRKVDELSNQIKNKDEEVSNLNNKVSEVERLKNDAIRSNSEIKSKNDEIGKLKDELKKYTMQVKSKNDEINDLKKRFNDSLSQTNSSELEANSLKLKLKEADSRLKLSVDEINRLKDLVNNADSQINLKNEEVGILNKKISEMNIQIKNKLEEIRTLNKKISELDSQINLKSNEINSLNSNIAALQEKNKKEITSLNEALSRSHLENINYIDQIKNYSDKIQEFNMLIANANKENAYLKGQISALEEKNNESFIKKLFKSGE